MMQALWVFTTNHYWSEDVYDTFTAKAIIAAPRFHSADPDWNRSVVAHQSEPGAPTDYAAADTHCYAYGEVLRGRGEVVAGSGQYARHHRCLHSGCIAGSGQPRRAVGIDAAADPTGSN